MKIYTGNPTKEGRTFFFKCRYKDITGVTKEYTSPKYLTKKEAEKAFSLFKLKENQRVKKEFSIVASAYFEEMYKKRKESTVYCYENVYNKNIKPYFERKDINSINIQDVNKWREIMAKNGFKLSYLNKCYTILNSIMKFAQKMYGLEKNYVEIVGCFENTNEEIIKEEEKIRYITFEQFKEFISVIDDITDYTLFNTFYYTGMRKGEIQALTWKEIDFNNSEIAVVKTLTNKTNGQVYKITSTKTCKNRKIKISKVLKETLLNYKNYLKETYVDFDEDWFIFGINRPMAENTIKRHKDKYFRMIGYKDEDIITIHEFRHSHVTLLINEYIKTSKEKNMKIDMAKFFLMLSNRMGHTIDVMQKTYMHLVPSVQDEIVDILDNLI